MTEFVNAVVDELEFEVVEADTVLRFDFEYGFVVEEESKGALSTEVAAEFVEIRAYICHGAGVVVSCSFHEDSDAVRAVSFVSDFLVVVCVFVGSLLDSALNSVFGHVCGFGVLHKRTETGVGVWVGTACFGGYGDFLAYARESTRHIAPAFEFTGFAVFKCSSHWSSVRGLLFFRIELSEFCAETFFEVVDDFCHHLVDVFFLQGLFGVLEGNGNGIRFLAGWELVAFVYVEELNTGENVAVGITHGCFHVGH